MYKVIVLVHAPSTFIHRTQVIVESALFRRMFDENQRLLDGDVRGLWRDFVNPCIEHTCGLCGSDVRDVLDIGKCVRGNTTYRLTERERL